MIAFAQPHYFTSESPIGRLLLLTLSNKKSGEFDRSFETQFILCCNVKALSEYSSCWVVELCNLLSSQLVGMKADYIVKRISPS